MTELKTDKNLLNIRIKTLASAFNREQSPIAMYEDLNALTDALHAHTLEVRTDKGVSQIKKIINLVEAGTFDLSAGKETALLYDLRNTKAILGGENNETHS